MKLTFGRIFETSLVGRTKAYEELAPLIDWLQQAIDNMARALTSQLGVQDNLDAEWIDQTIRSTTATASLEFKTSKTPKALLLAAAPVNPKITSWGWKVTTSGNVQVILTLDTAPTAGVAVRFLAIYS